MILLDQSNFDHAAQIICDSYKKAIDSLRPKMTMLIMHLANRTHVVKKKDHSEPVIKTRSGVEVLLDEDKVLIGSERKMLEADWEMVPGILASLRGALVPAPRSDKVSPGQAEACLEIASGFNGETDEVIFTVEDAEDITENYDVLAENCPNKQIATEINELHRVGARKLFCYIENEILSV